MKINCGLSYPEKVEAWKEWHPYFAWLPKRVATRDCRWLETIERKKTFSFWGVAGAVYDTAYRARVTAQTVAKDEVSA